MKILVTGVTGFVGGEFARRAASAGHDSTVLARRDSPELRSFAADVVVRDVFEVTARDVPDGVTAVVHFATGTAGDADQMVEVAVRGTLNVLEAATSAGCERFVHVSSLSVYPGPVRADPRRAGGLALEPFPARRGAYARSKTLAELALHEAAERGQLAAVDLAIVRPGLVFGTDMADVLAGTAVQLPLGLTLGLGDPVHGVPFLDVADLCEGLLGLLELEPEPGSVRVFDVLSGERPGKRDLVEVYRAVSGQDGRDVWVPFAAALPLAWLLDRVLAARTGGNLTYNVRRLYRFDARDLPARAFWDVVRREPHGRVRQSIASALTIDRAEPGTDGGASIVEQACSLLEVASREEPHDAATRPLVVFGAGRIFREMHAPALAALRGARVRAIVEPNRALAVRAVQDFPGARTFPSLADLDDDVLAGATALIATPGSTHHVIARELLERGTPLLVEKPVALTREEYRDLVERAGDADVPVTVFHNYRLRPGALALWEFLVRHDVGSLVALDLVFHSRRVSHEAQRWLHDEKASRALVMELGIHFLDLAFALGGAIGELRDARVVDRRSRRSTVSFSGTAQLDGCGRFAFDLDLSGTAPRTRLTATFERAVCVLDFFPDGFRVLPRRANPLDDLAADARRLASALGQRLRPTARGLPKRVLPHLLIYREHLRALRGDAAGTPFDLTAVADTMESLYRLCDVAYGGLETSAAESARLMESRA